MDTEESSENDPPLDLDRAESSNGKSRKCCNFSPQSLVCVSHALSAWGDRMWEFAVALYLVKLTPNSLRLTAIFQLIRTLCLIFLGPFVGKWVDLNPRLRVAQVSLVAQNLAVAASALVLLLVLSIKVPYWLFVVLVTLVILVACISVLAGVATKVAIEKDWVVVITGQDKALLAATNAIMRRIDLVCKILAPALVGQVMTYVSNIAGVILIAAWNVVSVFLEYYMLLKVFRSVPSLAHKRTDKERQQNQEGGASLEGGRSGERLQFMEGEDPEGIDTDDLVPHTTVRQAAPAKKTGVVQHLKNKLATLKEGWEIYMRQSVARPGISLAMLYFTVISFGSISTGYLYTQKMSESVLSILRGVGSICGILATFAFPSLRNAVGLVRSGLFSMSAQFICLLFCFFAVFAPGSPFFLLPDTWRYHGNVDVQKVSQNVSTGNCTFVSAMSLPMPNASFRSGFQLKIIRNGSVVTTPLLPTPSQTVLSQTQVNSSSYVPHMRSTIVPSSPSITSTHISPSTRTFTPSRTPQTTQQNCSSETKDTDKTTYNFSYISVILLLVGIITSRFGLWLSDLSITQLQQETVPEEERGRVGTFQKSLNSVADMMIYVFVISLPKPEQYGLMALMSVAAVGVAGIIYASFAYKIRGHLFHFERLKGCSVRDEPPALEGPQHDEAVASSQDSLGMENEEEASMLQGMTSTRNEHFRY